ncbi:MAG: OmpA family protein [Pseudomonadota bacterium]
MSKHNQRGVATPIVLIVLLLIAAAAGWALYFNSQQALRAIEDVQAKLDSANQENVELQSNFDTMRDSHTAAINKLDAMAAQIDVLEEKSTEADKLRSALDKSYEDIKTLTNERDAARELTGAATEQSTELMAELEAAKASDVRGREQLAELVAQMEASQQSSDEYRSQLDAARNELSSTSEQAETLGQRIAELEAEREQERAAFDALQKKLDDELGAKSVEIDQRAGRPTVIRMQNDVLFASGSAELRSTAKRALDSIGGLFQEYPDRLIQVEGHTDNVPISKLLSFPSNWELSAARASAAVRYLIGNVDISPNRLRVAGLGEYSPIADNETAEGRALNRRIEIILLPAADRDEVKVK